MTADHEGVDPEDRPEPVPEPLPPDETEVLGEEVPHTGVSVVDDVLASLQGFRGRPVEEQVPGFERAQEGLRGVLDQEPGDAGDPGDSAGA